MAHVLVVDDEKSIRVTLRAFLLRDNHRVTVAENAHEAEHEIETSDFDVVITDIIMPKISGLELLAKLHAQGKNTEVILITGEPNVETAIRAVQEGAFDYLAKPISGDHVCQAVTRAARAKFLKDENQQLERANKKYAEYLEELVVQRTDELRQTTNRLSAFMESAPNAFVIMDKDLNITEINQAGLDMLPVPVAKTQVVGQNIEKAAQQVDETQNFDHYRNVLQTGNPVIVEDALFETPMGTMHLNVRLFKMGDSLGAIVVDITERKRAEQNIRRSNRALRVLSHINRTRAHATSERELLQKACDALVDIGGYPLVWIGLPRSDAYKTIVPVAQTGFADDYLQALALTWGDTKAGDTPAGKAVRHRMPVVVKDRVQDPHMTLWGDPKLRSGYASSISLPMESEGQVVGVLNVYSSSTSAFDAEEERLLTQLAEDLCHGMSTLRTREERQKLKKEKLELETQLIQAQKMEAIGTLAAGVAHEVNNPTNIVMNYADMIIKRTEVESDVNTFAQSIIGASERIAAIVKNLLDFARQETEPSSLAQIQDIVGSTLSLTSKALQKEYIKLEVDIPSDTPPVPCRSQQIMQVLMNLVTNARDSLNTRFPGQHADKKIKITAQPLSEDGKAYIRTTVADLGTGIPKAIADRIFEPFFTSKPRDQGTGLGLSISHGIVRDHQGRLHMDSMPGSYTRFHLDLPISES